MFLESMFCEYHSRFKSFDKTRNKKVCYDCLREIGETPNCFICENPIEIDRFTMAIFVPIFWKETYICHKCKDRLFILKEKKYRRKKRRQQKKKERMIKDGNKIN